MASDALVEVNQRRLWSLLQAHKIDYFEIDGAVPENKDQRNELFDISKVRGKYPQCFLKCNSTTRFVGLWEEIEVIY